MWLVWVMGDYELLSIYRFVKIQISNFPVILYYVCVCEYELK